MKKIVYIAHPISGDIEANLKDLRRILRDINLHSPEIIPLAPYYGDCVALDDSVPVERRKGIDNSIYLLDTGIFDELWLTGDKISPGMEYEITHFKLQGKSIKNHIGKF